MMLADVCEEVIDIAAYVGTRSLNASDDLRTRVSVLATLRTISSPEE